MKNLLILLYVCSIFALSCGVENDLSTKFKDNKCVLLASEIHGGVPSAQNAWPSTVAITAKIRGNHKQFCTGVLVTEDVVLTAAHCLSPWLKPFEENIKIYIGNGEIKGDYEGQHSIKEAILHPKYMVNEKTNTDFFDFAYIVLKEPVNLEEITILPVIQTDRKMNEILKNVHEDLTIVGYGYTEEMSTGVKYEVTTSISSNTETEIAMGGNGKDSCRGDSGGPVFIKLNNKYHLFGITSRGGVCGGGGVYGKINIAIDWIKKELGTIFPYSDILSPHC